ncbi:MAG TPA: histidine kinase [Clostridium sp.]|nr:histidine kinase [Clostridium sp.]
MENTHNTKHREYTIEDLEELLDKIPYELWIKDENGRHKYINKIGAERMGMKKEDIIGKTDFEFRPYNMAKSCAEGDQKVLNNDIGILSEDKIELENNDKWYEVYKVSFENSTKDGKLIGGVGKEISVDKSLKDGMISSFISAINNNEFDGQVVGLDIIDKLKDRLSAKDIAIYLYDSEKNLMTLDITTCNDKSGFCDTYSFSEQEKIILEYSRYIPVKLGLKDKKYAYPIKFKQHILGALAISYDKMPRYIQEDIIKYTCTVMYIMLDNRQLSKALNKELIEKNSTQRILKMVINTVIDAYAILKVRGYKAEWIDMSKRCTDIFGWVCEEVNELTLLELLHPDDSEKLKRIMGKGVQEYNNFMCRILCRNNEYKYIDLNWSNLHDNLYIVTARDITNETNLKKDKENLEEAVEIESLKTEFFANLSHEFKTPLNIILSTVQVLNYIIGNNEKFEADKLKQYINGIKQNSYRLLKLADNMIDITKIDGGYYELQMDNYNIVEIVENIVLSVADYMKNNKRNIIFDTTEEEIITACDPEQIERIILNLLSNSLKFTSVNGNIVVGISVSEDCRNVIIKVSNDGLPIDKNSAKKIFGRFTQIDNLLTRSNEGSGIGLSLVKSLVEIHKGKIYVNTEVSKGTEFCIEIPIRKLMNSPHSNVLDRNINSRVQKYRVEFSDIYSVE